MNDTMCKKKPSFRLTVTAFLMLSFVSFVNGQGVNPQWRKAAAGVWSATIGVPEAWSLRDAAGASPDRAALTSLGQQSFPQSLASSRVTVKGGRILIRIPLQPEEQIFGLGLNFKKVQQRGRVLDLHVDHYGGSDNGRTHAPVPFYVSSAGYGVLIDAPAYITVYAGTGLRKASSTPPKIKDRNTDRTWEAQPVSDSVEIALHSPGARIYLFAGPSLMEVVQRFNLFNGGGVLPPKWGLGFTQRVPTLYSADEVRREVDAFDAHGFPLDFIGLEPGWQSSSYPCTFEWARNRFPDPDGFARELLGRGVRLNLWLNPYVSPKSPIYKTIAPFTGSHNVWNGNIPDTTLPAARKIISDYFQSEHLARGVSGYKLDEVDGYDQWLWPDTAVFPSGLSGEHMRQIYGLLWQRMTADWFHSRNQRTWGLVRASNAGASSLPYVIYNDYYDHRDFITALVNSGFSGVLWTPEVRASKTSEEWLRRFQSVCFSPMAMINAWSDGTKPWSYPEVENQVRDVALLRMRLLPYIYSSFAQYRFEGKPPVRAMYLVEGFKVPAGIEVKDQFMLGDNLLVAPMFAGQEARKVYFPEGKWYDFYTGKLAGNGGVIEVRPGLDHIPLFVRDGGIIPMMAAATRTPSTNDHPVLEVRVYGRKAGDFALYDDDGSTFNFEKGDYYRGKLEVSFDSKGLAAGMLTRTGGKRALSYGDVRWDFSFRKEAAEAGESK